MIFSQCAAVVVRAKRRGFVTSTRQQGAAIIIAMLVAALAAAVAVSVATGQQRWLASVTHRGEQVQAQSLALAGVQWARQILFEDASQGPLDFLGEPWALPLPPTPLENGSIEGRIVDAQGLLNVNNLGLATVIGSTEHARFERLFDRIGTPRAVLEAITDWVDADDIARTGGAEDAWYSAQPVPGLAANANVVRVGELSSVRGVTPDVLTALLPYVTALPPDLPLNVNTAPPAVLAAAAPGLSDTELATLIASRARRPFGSVSDFHTRLPPSAVFADDRTYTVSSRYFVVTVRARQGDTQAQARALLKRDTGAWPSVVWQVVE
jgi:general secretion pathway protein K